MFKRYIGISLHNAHDVSAGCRDFRFHESFLSGADGRERSKEVVAWVEGSVMIRHGANGDDIRHVARGTDGHGFGTVVSC